MPEFQTICPTSEIPEGEARMFVIKDVTIGIFHVAGEFFVLENHCPHAGASLAHGYIDGDVVSCRIHRWRFSIRDGTYLDENKPQCDACKFPVRVVGGEVQVEL